MEANILDYLVSYHRNEAGRSGRYAQNFLESWEFVGLEHADQRAVRHIKSDALICQ